VAQESSHRVHLRVTGCRDSAGVIDFLENDACLGDAEAGAAEFFRYQRGEPTQFGEFADEGFGIFFFAIDLTPVGVGKLLANLLDLLADLLLFHRQVEIHHFLL
jgi:hypothetical protein